MSVLSAMIQQLNGQHYVEPVARRTSTTTHLAAMRQRMKDDLRDRFKVALQTPKSTTELSLALGCSRNTVGSKIAKLLDRGEPIKQVGVILRAFGNKEKVWAWVE